MQKHQLAVGNLNHCQCVGGIAHRAHAIHQLGTPVLH
jgi:hypothetical protein